MTVRPTCCASRTCSARPRCQHACTVAAACARDACVFLVCYHHWGKPEATPPLFVLCIIKGSCLCLVGREQPMGGWMLLPALPVRPWQFRRIHTPRLLQNLAWESINEAQLLPAPGWRCFPWCTTVCPAASPPPHPPCPLHTHVPYCAATSPALGPFTPCVLHLEEVRSAGHLQCAVALPVKKVKRGDQTSPVPGAYSTSGHHTPATASNPNTQHVEESRCRFAIFVSRPSLVLQSRALPHTPLRNNLPPPPQGATAFATPRREHGHRSPSASSSLRALSPLDGTLIPPQSPTPRGADGCGNA